MKVICTLVRRSTTPQRLYNFQQPKSKLFTVNPDHSQLALAALSSCVHGASVIVTLSLQHNESWQINYSRQAPKYRIHTFFSEADFVLISVRLLLSHPTVSTIYCIRQKFRQEKIFATFASERERELETAVSTRLLAHVLKFVSEQNFQHVKIHSGRKFSTKTFSPLSPVDVNGKNFFGENFLPL